jgi:predicted RNase H-like nuclease (RuvC/YqgF family)
MDTSIQIDRLNERQKALEAIMAKSDPHLWGVLKKTLEAFRKAYPADYDEYIAANTEYNTNEATLAELENRLAIEAEEIENLRHIEEE